MGDINGDGHQDLVWYNPTTGVVSAWRLNGSQFVQGTHELDKHCTAASGCASKWHPVDLM
jgi:hypothetical protein